ncbi:MAG: hypothetical protein M0Z87_11575 [Actinomycetota bacterium]|nr:hypothetical protein [Actinomycetota bacterium]
MELAKGLGSAGSEDPVHTARIESERAEALLELCDVVTSLHRRTQVEEPVSQIEPCFDQPAPSLPGACAVLGETPLLLEGADRVFHYFVVDEAGRRTVGSRQGGKPAAEIGDGFSATSRSEREVVS